ncbi:MAG: ornithine cyclodeaminase [Gemmatales bacterium]|nr:MAG: ornithine cyclodeaminase [Gemmatales bacterium]
MAVLFLKEDDVRQLLTMDVALAAVEEGLRHFALEEMQNTPRARTQTGQAMLHIMSASARTLGFMGYKAYATSKHGAFFHVGLFDGTTGELLALMQADFLGQMRTGAASGVATKYMARQDARDVGIFGSGRQARTQLQAVCLVRAVRKVHVYSRHPENRRRFADEMSKLCQTSVEPVDRPELAAQNMDIVITATTSREPVLFGTWLAEGAHINAIGANFIHKTELDPVVLRRCKTIVVDSKEQARIEAGEFVQAIEEGTLKWSDVCELGQVVVGRNAGRVSQQDITLFKSLGIAVEDVAVAAKVYRMALERNAGRMIEW